MVAVKPSLDSEIEVNNPVIDAYNKYRYDCPTYLRVQTSSQVDNDKPKPHRRSNAETMGSKQAATAQKVQPKQESQPLGSFDGGTFGSKR